MAIVANLAYIAQGLSVTFTDLSLGNVASRSWDFGDGTSSTGPGNNSVRHTYIQEGFYNVTLSVTAAGLGAEVTSMTVSLGPRINGPALAKPILIRLNDRVPLTLQTVVTTSMIWELIRNWQEFLGPLCNPAIEDIYNEFAWPNLELQLLEELIFFDILDDRIKNYLLGLVGNGPLTSSGTSASTSKGGIKKIVTGPTEVEWYNEAQSLEGFTKQLEILTMKGGLLDNSRLLICTLASRLKVILFLCPELNKPHFAPIIGRTPPTAPGPYPITYFPWNS